MLENGGKSIADISSHGYQPLTNVINNEKVLEKKGNQNKKIKNKYLLRRTK